MLNHGIVDAESRCAAVPELVVLLGDQVVNKYVFDKDVISVGRSRDNDIVIENLAVSRNHCRIRQKDDRFFLTDLNSANGTEVNGVAVTKTELQHDDVVSLGKHKIIFKNEEMSDEALISDAFGAERTMIVDQAPVAYLLVTRGKQKDLEFRVDKAETTIGRASDCDLCLHDWFVSKKHAEIHRQGNSFLLRDAGSWRGTKVNDSQVTETVLKDGDEVQVGGTRLSFRFASPEELHMPTGRVPLELGPSDSVYDKPRETIVDGAEAENPEWDRPIRAGGEDDFIKPSAGIGTATEEMTVPGAFDDLDEELRDGAEMIRDVINTPLPVDVEEELAEQFEAAKAEAAADNEEITEVPESELPPEPEEVVFEDGPQIDVAAETVEVALKPDEDTKDAPFRGIVVDKPLGYSQGSVQADGNETPEPVEAPVELEGNEAYSQAGEAEAPEIQGLEEPTEGGPGSVESQQHEILLWESALKNKSPIIRKQAARMLKRLTGRDYDC